MKSWKLSMAPSGSQSLPSGTFIGHLFEASPDAPDFLINTGSVGLSYDGDPRASYLLLDDGIPTIRRVEYDIERELKALSSCGLPGAEWTAKMLRTSSPQMP